MLYGMNLSQMVPRHLQTGDEKYVRDIYRICHPNEPARPSGWYFTNPTLVIEDISKNNFIVGFTSFTIESGSGATMLLGKDVCVLPKYQGRGLAKILHAARLTIGLTMGAKVFIGATKDPRMAHILKKAGAHRCMPLGEGNYTYMGPIEEL